MLSLARSAGLVSFLLLRPNNLAHAFSGSSKMASSSKHASSLKEAGVIPDVLPDFTPKLHIRVSYNRMHVLPGDQLLPVQAVHVPLVALEHADAGKNYTLIM